MDRGVGIVTGNPNTNPEGGHRPTMEPTTLRNTDLVTLADALKDENARKWDIVVPASSLTMADGKLLVTSAEPILTDDGVETLAGPVSLTVGTVASEQLSDRLGIPRPYFRRLQDEHLPLLDANVNGWLERDDRVHFIRALRSGNEGFARAVVSRRYRVIDNFDVLLAALDGIHATGIDVRIDGADLTERRMYVRIYSPEIAVAAERLVSHYRDPRSGNSGHDYPLVWAGFVLTNSDVGNGAFSIVPRLVFQVCTNGMTRAQDAHRSVHLGGTLEEGVIDWSEETQQRQIELVASQTRDAVTTFLSAGYVEGIVAQLEEHAEAKVENPIVAIQQVTKRLRYSDTQATAILNAFVQGGDTSAMGVAQAITQVARYEPNADLSAAMEDDAFTALAILAEGR
jgi:hypothetical protein